MLLAAVAALVLLGFLVGDMVVLSKLFDAVDPTRPAPSAAPAAPPPSCPPPAAPQPPPAPAAAPVRLPPPEKVQLRVLNGTPRDRLSVNVGDQLAARGFRISAIGNAPRPQNGPSQVFHAPDALPAARQVAVQLLDAQPVLAPQAPPGTVDLVLGTAYTRLRTPAEVPAAVAALNQPAPPPAPPRPPGCP